MEAFSKKHLQKSLSCVSAGMLFLVGLLSLTACGSASDRAAKEIAEDFLILQEATLLYYIDNQKWPVNLALLKNFGYVDPTWKSSTRWQTSYQLEFLAGRPTVVVDIPNMEAIQSLKRYLVGLRHEKNRVFLPIILSDQTKAIALKHRSQNSVEADEGEDKSNSDPDSGLPRSNVNRLINGVQ